MPFKISIIPERRSSEFHLALIFQAFNLEIRLFNLVHDSVRGF